MDNRFFHKIGHKLPTNHYMNHCLITLGLFILLLVLNAVFGSFIAFASGAILFYWSRELAQWEIRGGEFEWKDVVYPNIFIFIIAILLTLIF
jgi:hypothetical protein